MDFSKVVEERQSVKVYDMEREVTDADLKTLFETTMLSPSSFNLQHWRFVAVRDPALKQQLCEASWYQEHVAKCAVDIVVCADLNAHDTAAEIYANVPADIQEKVLPIIQGFYGGNEQLARDEALRSGSLASMTLMLAAKNLGMDTCPMIGFDPAKVTEIIKLPEGFIPVMMITLGYAAEKPRQRGHRYEVADVVRIDSFEGNRLE